MDLIPYPLAQKAQACHNSNMPKLKKKTAKKAVKKNVKKKAAKTKVFKATEYESYHYEPRSEYELTENLNEELKDAWVKVKNFATELGEQRVYTSARAMMFARRVCYFFLRPKKAYIELVFFLSEEQSDPLIFRTEESSKTRISHTVKLIHEDQVESPVTDWLQEAYSQSNG